MDINEYSELALRTANDLGPTGDLLHAALLISSEAGEVADVVKKNFAYGKSLDRIHLLEELGDLAWGMNLMIKTAGLTWGQVLGANIAKLEKRYPDLRFSAEHALNRHSQLELDAINKVL